LNAVAGAAASTPTHELVDAFAQAGLPLHPTLREMLGEHPSHRTERRGCGYTQATRFLSTFVNQPRDPVAATDLGVFDDWPRSRTETLARSVVAAGWADGWRGVDRIDAAVLATLPGVPVSDGPLLQALAALPARLAAIAAALRLEESALLLPILRDLLVPAATTAPALPPMREKPEIGSCSQAEEFFLEIAHGRVRRGGKVNVFVDDDGRPLLVEKMALGESHSAMAVAPVSVCGVTLPPGALFALRYDDGAPALRAASCGAVHALGTIAEARFLRLTTLAVAPAVRRRAFSAQFEAQIRGNMLSPQTTTIAHLHAFATARLAER
jgi:hypothetical protein